MKICIFTETFHPVVGGGETQARLLADGLGRLGHSVFVLTRRSSADLPRAEHLDGLRVRRLPPVGSGQLKKWGLILSGAMALLRERRAFDLVFVSGFRIVGIAAVPVARLLGKRVVLKADSQGEMSGAFFLPGLARFGASGSGWLFRAFIRLRNRILRRAHAFVAITDDVAAELADAGIERDAVHRIPNAVDTTKFSPPSAGEKAELRRRLGLPPTAKAVIYTGRLVTYKGLPLLLDVWSRLSAEHPSGILVLVGTGGLDIHACEDELRETVRRQGLEDRVVFTGSVTNVHDFLRASDIFAFPTNNDAFPSSLIEAMAVSLPVVATPVGAIGDVVSHEQNGLLVPPGDAGALERALGRLMSDRDLAEHLGRAGLKTVREAYSADRITRRYAELFERVAGKPSSTSGSDELP